MANKNINKFIAFAAITGAAIAAGIAYFKHKNDTDLFNDDLDDEDDDFDFPLPTENDENSIKREYVSLNLDTESNTIEESKEDAPNLEDSLETTTDAVSSDEAKTI